jgi:5'-3' exonuclease
MDEKPAIRDVFWEVQMESLESLESYGDHLAKFQRGINWYIGDVARYAKARYPDTWNQIFPEWMSPGLVERCIAVAKAYPQESDRNPSATWTIHMQHASDPDRLARVAEHVEKGRTSDEAKKATPKSKRAKKRWLLAIDVNYWLHRHFFSGQGVEAASGVADWLWNMIYGDRKGLKSLGLTDAVCCFDSKTNHRKKLTEGWEQKYKDRPKKDVELSQQLRQAPGLMEKKGFLCASIEGMESDDLMASYAEQFDGRVSLLTQDKDLRQCLSQKTNILLDVDWHKEPISGTMMPSYKWLSAKGHTAEHSLKDEQGNPIAGTGITPAQWTDYQAIMGDTADDIKGVVGIGQKGAADLLREFGTLDKVIAAAKDDDERIKAKQRKALVEFEPNADITRQLVTLRTDLDVPTTTRLS